MEDSKFKCPLCDSPLSESQYYKIIRAWEEKQKLEKDLKLKLVAVEENKKKLILEQQKIKKQLIEEKAKIQKQFEEQFKKQKADIIKKSLEEAKNLAKKDIDKAKLEIEKKAKTELKKAQKEALEQGKIHEKKRADKLSNMLEGKMKEMEFANKTIKELKEQLKKGTTPQIEGLNFEEELAKELKQIFPEDKIEKHGHMGDILHYVMHQNKQVGLIIYECKKTQTFQKNYINQIKEDVAKRNASYGVLVTFASEKGKAGFWVDKDIIIVHPYGAIYVAEVIRKWLVGIYSLKLNKDELGECAKKMLDYIKSDKFKNCIEDTIYRARELNNMLRREVTTHKNIWDKRLEHYNKIQENVNAIDIDSNDILQLNKIENKIKIPKAESLIDSELPLLIKKGMVKKRI